MDIDIDKEVDSHVDSHGSMHLDQMGIKMDTR